MRFQKGISGNPGGRPVGAKNKTTAKVIELIARFLEANLPDIQHYYTAVPAKEKLRFIASLLNYVVPKQQSIAPFVDDATPEPDRRITIVNSYDEIRELDRAKNELDQARAEFERDQQKWLSEHKCI